MGIDPASLAIAGLATSFISSGIGAVGSISAGNASAAAANYNSQIALENATIAKQNSNTAAAAGEAQAGQEAQKTRATVGGIKAAQAANGIEVNSGSAVDVRSSAAELGQLSALNIRSNAARTAYGYQTQAASETAQSQLDKYQGEQSQLAGEVGAATTVLGGAGSSAMNYANFLKFNSPISAT